MNARELVDYAGSLDCIHCGLCLRTCPTYRLTGAEPSSPRGRIHLMRAVAEETLAPDRDFAEEMDFCLVCRHCESVCPAGVQFGAMMEHTRDRLASEGLAHRRGPAALLVRLFLRRLLPSRRALRLAFGALRLAQRTGVVRLARILGARGRALASLPPVPPARERRPLPPVTPARRGDGGATGSSAASELVLVLEGCVQPELYGRVNRATARVLAARGSEVRAPREHVCCGALHAHNGDLDGARALARATIARFEAAADGAPHAVVVNAAGCGAHMKEYGRLFADDPAWAARAEAFATRVRDLAEHLAAEGRLARAPLAPSSLPQPVAWDDPCHLCHGQGVRAAPRALLDAVPGLARVELDESESCCGSAGIYSLLRPLDSAEILAEKLAALRRSGARTLVTANPGCQMQWESGIMLAGLDVRVVHLAEVLDGTGSTVQHPLPPLS